MEQTPVRKRRWVWPLLFVSLAVNLLIVGVAVGWVASPEGPRRASEQEHTRGAVAHHFVQGLDEQQRRALFRDAVKNRDALRENRREFRGNLDTLLVAIRATPFDPTTVQQVLMEQRATVMRRQEIGEALLLNRLTEMTDEERVIYAAELEKRMKRFKRRND